MTRSDRADHIAGALAGFIKDRWAPNGLRNEQHGLVRQLAWDLAQGFPERPMLKLRHREYDDGA